MIPAIVLAAGRSTRMGRPKALLPIGDGETFLSRIVRTMQAAGVDDVVVVLGHEAEPIAASLAHSDLCVRFAVNRQYHLGQLSSLITGLNVADRPGVDAVLVTLVDVPLVSAATARAVLDRYREVGAPIVRPTSGDRHGHPLLIARSIFDELRGGDPAVGMKLIIRSHASAHGDVAVVDDGAFVDIDTPAEYERAVRARSRP